MSKLERTLNAVRHGCRFCHTAIAWFGNLNFVRRFRNGIETVIITARLGNVTVVDLVPPFAPMLAAVIHQEVVLGLVSATMSLTIRIAEKAILSK